MKATLTQAAGRSRRLSVALLALGLAIGLGGCSVIRADREARASAEALDKAGRIDMVLDDEVLKPDPALLDSAVILPDMVERASWPQTGAGAQKAPGHVRAAEELAIAWSVDAGAGSSRASALTAAPVTSETAVFVLDADQVVQAFDIQTGAKLWSKKLKSASRRDRLVNGGGIAYDAGTLYVASGFGFVAALDAASGSEVWRREFGVPMIGSPTLAEGRLFVVSNNNEVFALAQSDGATEWTDQGLEESARVLASPSPAAVEDIVVVPFSSGEVITYLASNGRRLWQDSLTRAGRFTPISAIDDIAARPVLYAGLVFAASQSGMLTAIDGRSGNRVWVQPFGSISAPALVGEYLFGVSVDGQAVAMLAATGQVVWVRQLETFEKPKKKKGRISYAGPVLASGRVILVSSRGEVIALSPQNGEETGRLRLKKTVFIEPVMAQGRLFVLTDDARLIAIR